MGLIQVPPQEALEHKFPERLVFVVTHDPDGLDDIMPAGWCMSCSAHPPMLAVALGPLRHTRELIERTGEFVIAFAAEGQVEAVTYTGAHSGRHVDKFAALGLTTRPGVATSVPLVEGCALAFECRRTASVECGDHVVYFGEIIAAHRSDPPLANLVNFGGWYSPALPLQPRP
jgi:flavin reductase (DIM6/NTAB) family NADH-FMN oxidoreductase RutF